MRKYKKVLGRLKHRYQKQPDSYVRWSNPLELVIATVLSAQCTDKVVNKVTPELFKRYRNARDYAEADIDDLRKLVKSTGFYNSKAKYLKGIGQRLVESFGGEVPKDHDALLTLPGVSNKTANLVMAKGFGINVGVAVDTHVKRIAPRLGWTKERSNTNKIERDLNKLIDRSDYLDANEYLILLGRDVCKSPPKCASCPLNDICPTGIDKLTN